MRFLTILEMCFWPTAYPSGINRYKLRVQFVHAHWLVLPIGTEIQKGNKECKGDINHLDSRELES